MPIRHGRPAPTTQTIAGSSLTPISPKWAIRAPTSTIGAGVPPSAAAPTAGLGSTCATPPVRPDHRMNAVSSGVATACNNGLERVRSMTAHKSAMRSRQLTAGPFRPLRLVADGWPAPTRCPHTVCVGVHCGLVYKTPRLPPSRATSY